MTHLKTAAQHNVQLVGTFEGHGSNLPPVRSVKEIRECSKGDPRHPGAWEYHCWINPTEGSKCVCGERPYTKK